MNLFTLQQQYEELRSRVEILEKLLHKTVVCDTCNNSSLELQTCKYCKRTECDKCINKVNDQHYGFWLVCNNEKCNFYAHEDCCTKNEHRYSNCSQCMTQGLLIRKNWD